MNKQRRSRHAIVIMLLTGIFIVFNSFIFDASEQHEVQSSSSLEYFNITINDIVIDEANHFESYNGMVSFVVFIPKGVDNYDAFLNNVNYTVNQVLQAMNSERGHETSSREIMYSVFNNNGIASVYHDVLFSNNPPPSTLHMEHTVFFWDRQFNFNPPANHFMNIIIDRPHDSHLYQGMLNCGMFFAFRSLDNPNLWDFAVDYVGTVFLVRQVWPPLNSFTSYIAGYNDITVYDNGYDYYKANDDDTQQRFGELEERFRVLRDMHRELVGKDLEYDQYHILHVGYESGVLQSSLWVERTQVEHFWQSASFRPPLHHFYTRQVGSRLYRGYLVLQSVGFFPLSMPGQYNVVGFYSGWIFSGGTIPLPWNDDCEYERLMENPCSQ